MERLTKRTDNGDAWYNHRPDKTVYNSELLQRLAYYEDMEEQGRLVVLPCKVGDKVWFVDRQWDRTLSKFVPCVNEGYVKAIKFSSRPTKITVEYPDLSSRGNCCKGADYFARNIGRTVFLTREEAEQALKGGAET